MRIGPTEILDTYAEAFRAWYTRLIITAVSDVWYTPAAYSLAGYATSVIGCDAEAGFERRLVASESPDGRPAGAVLLFAFKKEKLAAAVGNRVGQCVLTCPTTSCFNGLPDATDSLPLGDYVRYFGDGFETQEKLQANEIQLHHCAAGGARDPRRSERVVWRVPVMDGEFVVEATAGVARGVAGGNIIFHAATQEAGLAAAQRVNCRIDGLAGIIAPFPGGVCRSGSKVGAKYQKLIASTHEAFCPTLRDRVPSQLVAGANCAYEIVIDGVDRDAVAAAMRVAIEAAAGEGVLAIGAGNYGGKLGKVRIGLLELFG